jgi:hypothetical protein
MDDHDDLLQRLRTLGAQPVDPARQSADLTAMVRVRPRPRVGAKLRLAGAFLAGLLIGSTGLAAADALPDPAQHVAHTALGYVGVGVPDPDRYHGSECGAVVKRNHGAYVRDDHSLAQSKCGKKLHAPGAADDSGTDGKGGDKANKADKGPCRGKPSWAGDQTLTAEERAAAQAARTAQCGSDADDADTPDATEPDDGTLRTEQQDTAESTSTTRESSTTTETPTTTVTTEPTTTSSP